ncbi:hypothetical protein B0H16DRAFT_1801523 [Mycena metata]|uniref:Uncharacterized protein n=1 Tax=Mycena metata TaxID=1033252 RepID=A0AAD7HBI2_9AGAR|nr:hypothetical protein B0H16DRAFT_1801523 [Mycena metata]
MASKPSSGIVLGAAGDHCIATRPYPRCADLLMPMLLFPKEDTLVVRRCFKFKSGRAFSVEWLVLHSSGPQAIRLNEDLVFKCKTKSAVIPKSATGNGNGSGGGAVPAPLTPSASTFRTHKVTLSASSLAQGSPISLPLDIPPSPKIPDQFMSSYVGSHAPPHPPHPNSAAIAKRQMSAKMALTLTDGGSSSGQGQGPGQGRRHRAQGSMASSQSGETHESTSLDTSGFEIVSPKMGGALSFPYHELDYDRPSFRRSHHHARR